MAVLEIPLSPKPQTVTIPLGPQTYNLTFRFVDVEEGFWSMDIADAGGAPILCGVPLVTGCDLLGQYKYLGIPGRMYVATDGDPGAVPTADNLGITSHLYFEPF